MTLIFPLMYLIVFGNAIGGTITGIPIGVVQETPYINETPLYLSGVDNLQNLPPAGKAGSLHGHRFYRRDHRMAGPKRGANHGLCRLPLGYHADGDVRLYLDSSEYTIPPLIQSGVTTAIAQTGAKNPIHVDNIYGTIEYLQFFGVGVIVLAIFMTTMMGGGLALIRDGRWGSSRATSSPR